MTWLLPTLALYPLFRVSPPPHVQIYYFDGCPNVEAARALVEQVAAELSSTPAVELVEVPDADAAQEMHFLGSPTVRVNGRDVEPGAQDRTDFVFACRVYRGEQGLSGQPEERWLREALTEAMSREPTANS